MEKIPEITPQKKPKLILDYQLCIICQKNQPSSIVTTNISRETLETLISRCKQRYEFRDSKVYDFIDRIRGITVDDIISSKGFYHRECHKTFSNIVELKRAEKRFQKLKDGDNVETSNILHQQVGRPKTVVKSDTSEEIPMLTRSQTVPYNKKQCVICQDDRNIPVHLVQTLEMGKKMLEVSRRIADKGFYRRLNSISAASDATANDVVYHNTCWIKAKRESIKVLEPIQQKNYVNALSDVEIIHFVDKHVSDPNGKVLDMNIVNEVYRQMLSSNGLEESSLNLAYKKHLKEVIAKNIDDISFVKNVNPSKPEQIISCRTESEILDQSIKECTTKGMEYLWNAAKIIRNEILNSDKWTFKGSFKDFVLPTLLSTFVKWILLGPVDEYGSEDKLIGQNKLVSIISQLIIQNVKSKRQVVRSLTKNNQDMSNVTETPLNIGLGLLIHQQTRNKSIVKTLSDLNLTANYRKVMKIKEDISIAVKANVDEKETYFPSILSTEKFPYFAIDNIDLKIDTPDGKNQLHGTVIVAYQQDNEASDKNTLKINRNTRKPNSKDPLYKVKYCAVPAKKGKFYKDYLPHHSSTTVEIFKSNDLRWSILKSLSGNFSIDIPTWAAFNSLFSEKTQPTTICTLPIISGSPTDWSNLSSALRVASDIQNHTKFSNKKAVVTLDLQLYSKCIQLQSNSEFDNNYIFRMGELHVVFTALKVLGKMIDNSGLDQTLEEAGIYGSTTLNQIKDGKHLYRCLEAHFTLYLALFKKYFEKIMENNEEDISNLTEIVMSHITENENVKPDIDFIKCDQEIESYLLKVKFYETQAEFNSKLKNQSLFLYNYMKSFQLLLTFIRASRQQNWILHLSSLHDLAKLFFAYDMLNYARLTPVYLAQMYGLKESDSSVWNFLEDGGFSVNKSNVPFTSLGVDHALEQENKTMKIQGGIKGIANNQNSLDQYFIIAPEVSNILEEFYSFFNIEKKENEDEVHYQFKGSKNSRMTKNVQKVTTIFDQYSTSFEESDHLYNTITKKIMPEKEAAMFLCQEEIGNERLQKFIEERINGEKSIWESISKTKLPTFKCNSKSCTIKINDDIVRFKEETALLTRVLVASKSRPEIDLRSYIGEYEFSNVPKSLFSYDGCLLKTTDKSIILREIENLISSSEGPDFQEDHGSVIIVDGMAIANKIDIQKHQVKTCKDFAEKFFTTLMNDCYHYSEIRVIFDTYNEVSLKSKTRENRTSGVQIRYIVDDDTNLQNTSTRKFLSHIKTKHDLTIYLSTKLHEKLLQTDKHFAVVNCQSTLTNISDFNDDTKEHSHEEADTLIILHAIDVARKNPFSQLCVLCADTDVFLLLLHFYPKICTSTIFKWKERKIDVASVYNTLGEEKSMALLGFHVFSGCDQTGKFCGFSKKSCLNTFFKSSNNVIDAFKGLGAENINNLYKPLEVFVLDLYHQNRPTDINSLQSLRWYMFTKFQCDSKKLPPTPSAFEHSLKRSYLVANLWKKSNVSKPVCLPIEEYGWRFDSSKNTFDAIMTSQPPAPKVIVELCVCKCKTGCKNDRCSCRKNQLSCTEMCLCNDCHNKDLYQTDDETDTED